MGNPCLADGIVTELKDISHYFNLACLGASKNVDHVRSTWKVQNETCA